MSLSLREFRCFDAVDLEFATTLNLIIGGNASGKTSLLEGIFLLGRGRSFRTAHLDAAIRTGSKEFQLTGKVSGRASQVVIGLSRENSQLQARIAGQPVENLAQLAETFPIQLMDSQSHQLIRGGPRHRRQFLDWGVFHVEPAFFPIWRRYHRALRQRNALLRAGKSQREIASWGEEVVSSGEALDHFRRQYLASLLPTASAWAGQALGGLEIDLDYRSGWPQGQRLSEAFQKAFERDCQTGMTQLGPHRAEMVITVEGEAVQERVSRGQEKALAGSLLLAQTAVYRELTGHPCTLLLDDLSAELDASHLARFMGKVRETGAQTHITAIEQNAFHAYPIEKVFHVKQGKIGEMV